MDSDLAVGIDLGGTHVKVGLVDRQLNVRAYRQVSLSRYDGPAETIQGMVDCSRDLLEEHCPGMRIVVAGVGSPGPLDFEHGIVITAANLPGWSQIPLRDELARQLGMDVVFDNDANSAAYGEYRADVGQSGDLVLLTLGTGVGAGVILGGKVFHGTFGGAGELGHLIVQTDGRPCTCGQRGCLEQYASASAVAKRYMEETAPHSPSTHTPVVDASQVAKLVRNGDEIAKRIWDDTCVALAVACIAIQHSVNPSRILLGGGMSQAGDLLVDGVRRQFDQRQWSLHNQFPAIELAQLGTQAGVVGAAALAWDS